MNRLQTENVFAFVALVNRGEITMRLEPLFRLFLGLVVMLAARNVAAAEITVNFAGHVATHNMTVPLFGGRLSPFIEFDNELLSRISGSFTYNTDTIDDSATPTVGVYKHTIGAPSAFELEFNDQNNPATNSKVFGSMTAQHEVRNDNFGENQYKILDGAGALPQFDQGVMSFAHMGNPVEDVPDAVLNFALNATTNDNIFGSDDLPLIFPDLSEFVFPLGGHTFVLSEKDGGSISIQLNSLSMEPGPQPPNGVVPEPTAFAIGMTMLFGLALCSWRRRKRGI